MNLNSITIQTFRVKKRIKKAGKLPAQSSFTQTGLTSPLTDIIDVHQRNLQYGNGVTRTSASAAKNYSATASGLFCASSIILRIIDTGALP